MAGYANVADDLSDICVVYYSLKDHVIGVRDCFDLNELKEITLFKNSCF